MARNLQELQKQYNSSASAEKRGMPMMRGPGGPRGMGKGKPKNTKNTIKRLFTYVGRYKIQLICVLFLMLISTVTSLIGSFMLAPIINKLVLYVSPNDGARLSLMERFSDNVISSFADRISGSLESIAAKYEFGAVMVYIAAALVILIGVYLVGVVATYLQNRLMIAVSQGTLEKIRNDLFAKIQK